jgi:hypothetical protein
MLNIAVPQVLLDRSHITPSIGQIQPTGMPEHMWMNRYAIAFVHTASPGVVKLDQQGAFTARFL